MTSSDPRQLITHAGPSLALEAPPDPGAALLVVFDSDTAAQTIDRLLSASGIPFHLERPTGQWAGTRARPRITVPADREDEALALLNAAADAGLLERAEGDEGLVHY